MYMYMCTCTCTSGLLAWACTCMWYTHTNNMWVIEYLYYMYMCIIWLQHVNYYRGCTFTRIIVSLSLSPSISLSFSLSPPLSLSPPYLPPPPPSLPPSGRRSSPLSLGRPSSQWRGGYREPARRPQAMANSKEVPPASQRALDGKGEGGRERGRGGGTKV